EANGTGSGSLSLRGSSTDAAFIDPEGNQYVRVVRDDGSTEKVIGGFFLESGDYKALTENSTELLTFSGRGVLAYLEREIVWSHTYLGAAGELSATTAIGQDPFDNTWRMFNQGSLAGGDFLGAVFWRA